MNKRGFHAGAFNSTLLAKNSKTNFIHVNKKGIKWPAPIVLRKIGDQGFDMHKLLFE